MPLLPLKEFDVSVAAGDDCSTPKYFPQLDKAIVQKALREDGAVILSNLHHLLHPSHHPSSFSKSSKVLSWSDIAANVPSMIFDKAQLLLLCDDLREVDEEEEEAAAGVSQAAAAAATKVPKRAAAHNRYHRADPVHVEHSQLGLDGSSLAPHSDGYIWGDYFPDIVILVCEQPASSFDCAVPDLDASSNSGGGGGGSGGGGGANYLIDGLDVVKRLDPTTLDLLQTTVVDHTERVKSGSYVDGTESCVPVIRWLNNNNKNTENITEEGNNSGTRRLCWRRMVGDSRKTKKKKQETTREDIVVDGTVEQQSQQQNPDDDEEYHPYLSLWLPMEGDDEGLKIRIRHALWEVDKAIEEESKVAKRFTLKQGQALIVDNFRMLHAREAFKGQESSRRMWRVWSWTTNSFGLPPQISSPPPSSDSTTTNSNNDATTTDDGSKDASASIMNGPATKIAANILEAQQVIQG